MSGRRKLGARFGACHADIFLLQFIATLVTNVEALTGSPVSCNITSFKSGSVVATIQTDFLDDDQSSATTYANVMKSGDVSSVFGTGYGSVSVDPNSVQTSLVSNPARKSPLYFHLIRTLNVSLYSPQALVMKHAHAKPVTLQSMQMYKINVDI